MFHPRKGPAQEFPTRMVRIYHRRSYHHGYQPCLFRIVNGGVACTYSPATKDSSHDGTNIVLFRSASNIPQLDVIQILHERGVQARAVQRETEFPDQVVRDTAFQPASLPPAS